MNAWCLEMKVSELKTCTKCSFWAAVRDCYFPDRLTSYFKVFQTFNNLLYSVTVGKV